MAEIFISTSGKIQFLDITSKIEEIIPSDFRSGICHLFCFHTTAALTINENADPDVLRDMIYILEKNFPEYDKEYRHSEGNSSAHIKSSLFGPSLIIPITNGKLSLGTWQGVYFCDFDGPRYNRKIEVKFISE